MQASDTRVRCVLPSEHCADGFPSASRTISWTNFEKMQLQRQRPFGDKPESTRVELWLRAVLAFKIFSCWKGRPPWNGLLYKHITFRCSMSISPEGALQARTGCKRIRNQLRPFCRQHRRVTLPLPYLHVQTNMTRTNSDNMKQLLL